MVLPAVVAQDAELTADTRLPSPRPSVPPAGLVPCLVQIYPLSLGLHPRFLLQNAPVVVGRAEECDIHLGDHAVSRRHARIEQDGDGYWVIDLGSTNGTFVNRTQVSRHRLQDGDNITIGHAVYRYLAGGSIEAAYHEEIQRLAAIDPLTELHNKRFLLEFLERELRCAERYRRPLALLLFDADHFKAVNDRLGHLGGDFTLRDLSACVREALPQEGLLARYGGEEFAAVLPETGLDDSVRLAERIRSRVERHPFQYESVSYGVTVSLGVAATPGGESLTPEAFIQQADEKLYEAKRQGRNRVAAG